MPILNGAFGRKLDEIKKGAMDKIKNPDKGDIEDRVSAIEANIAQTNKIIKQLAGKGVVETEADLAKQKEKMI
jgi:hypothetical protein